jgi:hypothetical protein
MEMTNLGLKFGVLYGGVILPEMSAKSEVPLYLSKMQSGLGLALATVQNGTN